jgi:hypothetical protein
MKSLVRTLLVVVLFPIVAFAQSSISGQWSSQSDQLSQRTSLSLSVTDDGKVTGSVILPGGSEYTITDGSITGVAVEFTTTEHSGDRDVAVKWVGSVSGDQISFSRTADGGAPQDLVVTRAR